MDDSNGTGSRLLHPSQTTRIGAKSHGKASNSGPVGAQHLHAKHRAPSGTTGRKDPTPRHGASSKADKVGEGQRSNDRKEANVLGDESSSASGHKKTSRNKSKERIEASSSVRDDGASLGQGGTSRPRIAEVSVADDDARSGGGGGHGKPSRTPKNRRRVRNESRGRGDGLGTQTEVAEPPPDNQRTASSSKHTVLKPKSSSELQAPLAEAEPSPVPSKRNGQEKLAMRDDSREHTFPKQKKRTSNTPERRSANRAQSAPRELRSDARIRHSQGEMPSVHHSHTRHSSTDFGQDKSKLPSMHSSGQGHGHTSTHSRNSSITFSGNVLLDDLSRPKQPRTSDSTGSGYNTLNLKEVPRSSLHKISPPRHLVPLQPSHNPQQRLETEHNVKPTNEFHKNSPTHTTLENANDDHRCSVEEPLLPKQQADVNGSRASKPSRETDSPKRVGQFQTYPRTKHHQVSMFSPSPHLLSSSASDRYRTGKTQVLLDRLRNLSSNQQEPYFTSLHKVPSQSSMSSDARSDVCLDLPETQEISEEYDAIVEDRKRQLGFPDAPYTPLVHVGQKNLCKVVFINSLGYIVSFILIWPLLFMIIVLVPVVGILRALLNCVCCGRGLWRCCCMSACHKHLTSSELVWLGKTSSRECAIVQSLIVLQKGLDIDRIRNLVDSRLLAAENRYGKKMYPRFTQKVVDFCCGRAWVRDNEFVTSQHVFPMPGYIEGLEDLQHFISKMASEPLSLDHPLWELQVLTNFREPKDTVLLFRMHLCMTDGVSLVHILETALVDSQKSITRKATFSSDASSQSILKVLFSGPLTFFSKYLLDKGDFSMLHGDHVRPSGQRVVAWSEPFSLHAASRVKQVARCTLTDLLLSITAGSIRTYLQMCGTNHPCDVTCAMPVDFQSPDVGATNMHNRFVLAKLRLPTNTEGAVPRLWEVRHTMDAFKSTTEAAILKGARWLTSCLLPVSCFQRMWKSIYNRCTMVVSNLAGPTSVLKVDSREVKCMMYWMPPLSKVTVSISFFTYADQIRMAVISDKSALPNPELLTKDFNHKLEILSKLLAHRRIPGETAASSRHDNSRSLSSFTVEDLTADQIELEMSLVHQEIHNFKVQLKAGPTDQISSNDTLLIQKIETLKERSRELVMHLRKRKAAESESAIIFSDEFERDLGLDTQHRPFRRRTMSMSSRLSTASVSSQARPLSTASMSNLPSPTHYPALQSWPERDTMLEELDDYAYKDNIDDLPLHRLPPFTDLGRHL